MGIGAAALLATALGGPAEAPREAIWVFFADKGLSAHELGLALVARRDELSARAVRRRTRVRGGSGVTPADLPPAPAYVRAALATGARHRASSRWLNAISVEVTPRQRRAIERLAHVTHTQPVARERRRDLPVTSPTPPALPGGAEYGVALDQLLSIGVPALHNCGLDGTGVVVGVLDTGFRLDHVALAEVDVIAAHDFINDDDIVDNEPGDPGGQFAHGTWVLGLLAGSDPGSYMGSAPGVSVLLAKTEDTSQEEPIEEDWYVEGLEWIESMGADIGTASLGYSDWYTADDMDGATAVTTIACDMAVQNGLIMFNSMGNAGPDPTTLSAPADAERVISVGATKPDETIANFSSRGPTADDRIKPDVVAPGAPVYILDLGTTDAYDTGSGTSFANPLTAGVGALLFQAYPDLTPAEMQLLLRETASQPLMPDNDYGWGMVGGAKAGDLYCNCEDMDGDGFYSDACGGTDCDDALDTVHPSATEVCDGIDNDCDDALGDGESDADGDGFLACVDDCDDASDASHPDAAEICDDGEDNDCNDLVDEADPACAAGSTGGDASTGGDSSTGTASSTTSGSDGSTGELSSGTSGPSTDSGTGSTSGDTEGAGASGGGGCGCGSDGPGRGGWLAMVVPALASRRRTRKSAPR